MKPTLPTADEVARAIEAFEGFAFDFSMHKHLRTLIAAAKGADAKDAALRWYRDEARGCAKAMMDNPPKPQAVMACVTVLSLDGGKRADAALAAKESP